MQASAMQAFAYQPKIFSFNRWSHRVMSLLEPEIKLTALQRGILIARQVSVPDTSIYEGLIDISKMISAGAQGVIAKASQGVHEDIQFRTTWTNAKNRLLRGCYHFYDPRFRPSEQVNEFASLVRSDPEELPLVVDWEASWSGTYQGWENLYNFLEELKAALPGHRIYIYTGYYYWLDNSPNPITQSASLNYFAQYDLWLAWYTTNFSIIRIPKPWINLKFLQYTSSGNGSLYGAQSGAIDLNYYVGTKDEYYTEYGGVNPNPIPPAVPVVHILKYLRSKVELSVTPSLSSVLPLKTVLQQAQENGWTAAMNCGAGFVYTDATHAQINVAGFQSILLDSGQTVYYARQMIVNGVVNPGLDTTYQAPWSMLGLDELNVYFIVTEGQEGSSGLTQMEAAQWAQAQGITTLYLFDSGHSSQISNESSMIYSAYGEAVPQCIGIKQNIGGAMTKGLAKAGTTSNIKRVIDATIVATLKGGDSVYGTLSVQATDIMNFDHFYRADGSRFELGTVCKVTVGNLTLTNDPEPGPTPIPIPVPIPTPVSIDHIIVYMSDGTAQTFIPQ